MLITCVMLGSSNTNTALALHKLKIHSVIIAPSLKNLYSDLPNTEKNQNFLSLLLSEDGLALEVLLQISSSSLL